MDPILIHFALQVLSLCKQLRDAQVVDRELRRLEGNEGPVEESGPVDQLRKVTPSSSTLR